MKRYWLFFTLLMAVFSCKEKRVATMASSCYPEIKDLKRGKYVAEAPVTVQLSGGLVTGKWLIASNGVAWGACNLSDQFAGDSLAIYVTGYFLTSKTLNVANLTPLPFEVTSARLR